MLAGLTSTERKEELEARVRYLQQRGRPVPADIAAMVTTHEIPEEHREMARAWKELSDSRAVGMSLCPIACADVEAWCRMSGVQQWRRGSIWRVLRRVDDVFLSRVRS